MDTDHADMITALSNRLPAELRDGRVRPLGIDRFGIRFRVEGSRERLRRSTVIPTTGQRRPRIVPGDPHPRRLPVPQQPARPSLRRLPRPTVSNLNRVNLRPWLQPARPAQPAVVTDPTERRAIGIEITIVLVLTFGLSAMSSILSLIEKAMSERGISGSSVALNVSSSDLDVIDFFRQLLSATKLFGIAALAVYLIWRAGVPLARIGLPALRAKFDIPLGIGLAALIGIPGLGLYVVARAMDLNVQVVPVGSERNLLATADAGVLGHRERRGRRTARGGLPHHPPAPTGLDREPQPAVLRGPARRLSPVPGHRRRARKRA